RRPVRTDPAAPGEQKAYPAAPILQHGPKPYSSGQLSEGVMRPQPVPKEKWEPKTLDFCRRALTLLNERGTPYLVGGAFGLESYTGIWRATKDLDLFVRPEDCPRVLELFAARGYLTEVPFPHWLGKVWDGGDMIDVIF